MELARKYLEIIYFLSGPALVIIAYIALTQIKIARSQVEEQRKSTRIAAKRDALRITSEQIKEYGTIIIPLIDILYKRIKEDDIKFFEKSEVFIDSDRIKVKPYINDEEIEKLKNISDEFTKATNAIEGFSSFFISGVADENVAYYSLSTTFCRTIKDFLPFIVIASSESNSYSATIKLFSIWNNRQDSESLKKQKIELEQKLKSKKEKTIRIVGDEP